MPAPELNINQLQLDMPVYAQDGELAGHLRFVYAENEPPYTVHSFILDRGNLGGNVEVDISTVYSHKRGSRPARSNKNYSYNRRNAQDR